MREIKIPVTKTARILLLGNENDPKHIWIICHGYAQLAPEFCQQFLSLENVANLLVFPEGLHRFYARGSSGRVGASWMTKEARFDDIADNAAYLDAVFEKFSSRFPLAKITVLGYSQGGATVCRWLEKTNHQIHHLVLYGATFPPDVLPDGNFSSRISGEIFHVLGNQDQYISQEEKGRQLAILKESGKPVIEINFEGGHEITDCALNALRTVLK